MPRSRPPPSRPRRGERQRQPHLINYEMNEPAGSSVMHDTGDLGLTGQWAPRSRPATTFDGAMGFRFPRLVPNQPPAHPRAPGTVPDNAALDPGTGSWSIEIRYKTTNGFGNIIQKGQSHTVGGQFKMQLPGGRPQCYSRARSAATVRAGRRRSTTACGTRCCASRTSDSVTLYVDGIKRGKKVGPMGNIDNDFPLTIGGKPACDQIKVTCDYFGGVIDYVRITKG